MDFGNGVAAHRGNMSEFPENTMPSFESAVAMGCSWLELDIQITSDGQLVVTHDANAIRVSGVDCGIGNTSFTELSKLNFGAYFKDGKHYNLPLLSDVLELVKNTKTNISIQPKQYGLIKPALELVKSMGQLQQVGFNDTNCEYLIEVKQLYPSVPVFWDRPPMTDLETDLLIAEKFGFETLMYEWQTITQSKVDAVKSKGFRFGACVINDEAEMKKYLGMGVQHFYTDYPLQLLKLL